VKWGQGPKKEGTLG